MTTFRNKKTRYHQTLTTINQPNTLKTHQRVLCICYEGKIFAGNNQQILLEQLELQGIEIPYSCRVGLCDSCRLTIVSGEVTALKQGAIKEDGTVLSCCCIPKSDLTLSPFKKN